MADETTTTGLPKLWAAFAGSAYSQEITVHTTEFEALWSCVEALSLDEEDRELDRETSDAADVRSALDDYCSSRADDWHVNEVELPACVYAEAPAMRESLNDLLEVVQWLQDSGNLKSPIEPHPYGLGVMQAKQTARALLARIDGTEARS